MVTKNIKKILLNKDGNKFVVDTENIVRSVNGVNASGNGNVTIPLPFVKTVNSTAPDSNGNVVLDLSSGGGVGFPDYSAGITLGIGGSPTEVPSDGWLYIQASTVNDYSQSFDLCIYTDKKNYPKNELCRYLYYVSLSPLSGDTRGLSVLIPIKKGQAVIIHATNNLKIKFVFYPFEQ